LATFGVMRLTVLGLASALVIHASAGASVSTVIWTKFLSPLLDGVQYGFSAGLSGFGIGG
jgi:hypothetical protein